MAPGYAHGLASSAADLDYTKTSICAASTGNAEISNESGKINGMSPMTRWNAAAGDEVWWAKARTDLRGD